MKHTSLLVPVLAAAALAAVASGPSPRAPLGRAEPARASSAAAVDPHSGLYAATAPHAASPAWDDPHAAHEHGDPHALADPHGPHGPRVPEPVPAVVAVQRSRAENGRTVAEVFEQRAALSGRRVSLRATVVKATDGVLGKTYLHLRDGSGSAELETHDLTATTTEAFEIGETVEVEGVLAIDQDVGLDYRYPALLGDLKRVR